MKEVTLKIKGKQVDTKGEENIIELVTEGKFYRKNNSVYLIYDETEISGMEGSTTTLRIQDEKVMMKRFGSNTSKLVFEKGKKHKTEYNTPYGSMDIEVLTSELNIDISDSGKGTIKLVYWMSIPNLVESKNQLTINIM